MYTNATKNVRAHFEMMNVLLYDYFEWSGDGADKTIVGHRYVGAISKNSQRWF